MKLIDKVMQDKKLMEWMIIESRCPADFGYSDKCGDSRSYEDNRSCVECWNQEVEKE